MASEEKRSRKRSGTKLPPEKQLEGFVFFIDRSLGKNTVPQALRDRGLNVVIHADHFPDDAPDTEWLTYCGRQQWVVFFKDKGIRYNELERISLLNAGVASFVLTSGNLTGKEMADAFLNALPQIATYLRNKKQPFLARINKNGRVELWIDSKGKNHLAK